MAVKSIKDKSSNIWVVTNY